MEEKEKKYCRHCGVETKQFWICDDCYPKMRQMWDEQTVICSVCEQKKTSSKTGICPTCKSSFIEEALNFFKSRPEY
jgi:hypothetical protein